jgi:hypothetical protein
VDLKTLGRPPVVTAVGVRNSAWFRMARWSISARPAHSGNAGLVNARCRGRARRCGRSLCVQRVVDAVPYLPGHDEVGGDDDGEVERLDPARLEAWSTADEDLCAVSAK